MPPGLHITNVTLRYRFTHAISESVSTAVHIPTVCQHRRTHTCCSLSIALKEDVLMTFYILTDVGQHPDKGFTMRGSGALVGSNLKHKNKRLHHVWCHLLSVSCHPSVNTKAPERTASNFSYSVNLQTGMAGIHWQIAVTEQGTLQWTNPFERSAFCRERQPAKTGHWNYIAIVSFLMQHCCLPQHYQRITAFWPFGRIAAYVSDRPQEGRNLNGPDKVQTKIVFISGHENLNLCVISLKLNSWPTFYSFWTWKNSHSICY